MSKSQITNKFLVGSGALLLFCLLTFLVKEHNHWVANIDQGAITLLSPLTSPVTTTVVAFISNLASPSMMTVYSIIIALYLGHRKQWQLGLKFLVLFTSFTLLNHLIKGLIERPRPTHRLVTVGGFSFPSGHTFATIILVFTCLTLLKKAHYSQKFYRIATICGWLVIILIAFTRIFLHAHFLSDTIGSLLLATASWQLLTAVYGIFGLKVF